MSIVKYISAFAVVISLNAVAQESAQPNLSRDRGVPPPEWNILADPFNEKEPSIKDIVNRTAKVYANLQSYQARAITLGISLGQNIYTRMQELARIDKSTHRFWIQRCFLTTKGDCKYTFLLWKDKEQLRSWSEAPNKVEILHALDINMLDEIPTQLAVDSVLMEKYFVKLSGKYRISDITENDVAYYRIQTMGINSYGTPKETYVKTTYWIRKSDALITRIIRDKSNTELQFKHYSRTDYDITVNQPIPESEFEFGH